jgi:D-alanyl-D-alanine carboxypeptidase/D-alanyl-D-alanine-endopeptidase (penicillin-binding protein 4)
MKKRILFILLILLNNNILFSQTLPTEKDDSANKALALLLSDDDLNSAGLGFCAIDINSGEIIVDYNSNMVLKPASTQKLVTTATALEVLGADFKFYTIIQYDGKLDTVKNILFGNLYIKGGGDPTLGSGYFTETKSKQFLDDWANAVIELGIDSITGYIIGDAQIYSLDIVPPTWSWEDMGNYFGAGACGLTIYDNYYTLYFKTSYNIGGETEITKMEPDIPGLTFDNTVTAANTNDDNSFIFGQPYKYDRYIRGELPLGKSDYKVKGSIPDPSWFAAYEFYNKLIAKGIKIGNLPTTVRILNLDGIIVPTERKEIFKTESPELSDIIYVTNQKSINLFTEHMLNHSGLYLDTEADTKKAAEAVEDYWSKKGMTTSGLSINDGSGLSHYDAISPKQLVFILNYMKNKSRYFEEFYNSLPVSGESGTLKKVCNGTIAEGKIHAKSGTIRNVRCYAGYTTSESGREIAFAMMINNYSCSSSKAKEKLESLMIGLVNL